MYFISILLSFFLSNVFCISAKISCIGEINRPVDWYVIYKIPKLETENELSMLSRGESYEYLNSHIGASKAVWVLSEKSVLSHDSILGNTLKPFYQNKQNLTYLLYNDEPAAHKLDLSTPDKWVESGHTKGVVVFDEDTGFWLVHSVPKFPPEKAYSYPKSGLEFGQSALCITFRTKELNEIGKQLLFNHPSIYSKGHRDVTINSLDDDVRSLFDHKPHFTEGSPFTRISVLRSLRGVMFTSFAKNAQFNADLYDGLVAPHLRSPLFVETWRREPGTPLGPSCHKEYVVENVIHINMKVFDESTTRHRTVDFCSFDDHSKWAVTSDPASCWVCIGDINRMKSQWKRGGGTVCFASPEGHPAYTSIISATDHC